MNAQHAAEMVGAKSTITVVEAQNICTFPAPSIYAGSANNLGKLDEYAHKVVHFYGQLSLIWETMRRNETADPQDLLAPEQVRFLAGALLNAAGAAADALPGFRAAAWAEKDARFTQQVAEARESFKTR